MRSALGSQALDLNGLLCSKLLITVQEVVNIVFHCTADVCLLHQKLLKIEIRGKPMLLLSLKMDFKFCSFWGWNLMEILERTTPLHCTFLQHYCTTLISVMIFVLYHSWRWAAFRPFRSHFSCPSLSPWVLLNFFYLLVYYCMYCIVLQKWSLLPHALRPFSRSIVLPRIQVLREYAG